jgi:hypothetical protein
MRVVTALLVLATAEAMEYNPATGVRRFLRPSVALLFKNSYTCGKSIMYLDDNDDLTPVDDELTPAPNGQNDDTQHKDEFRLEQGGETGLIFEARESTGIYGLSNETDAPQPADSDTHDDARKDAPKINADVYDVAAPDPAPSPSAHGESGTSSKTSGKKAFRKNAPRNAGTDSYADDDISLETLRERRQRTLMEEERERDKKKVERVPLPPRPFRDNLLKPFTRPGCIARIAMIAGAAFIPLLLATFFFALAFSREFSEQMKIENVKAFGAFFTCIWNDRVVFMLFSFLWGIFSLPVSFQIFIDTANGVDEIDEWPEFNFVGVIIDFLWILTLIVLAGIPGAALFTFLDVNYFIGFTLSSTILTPVFFLSCMQTDARFTLLTKEILVSFKNNLQSWLIFVGISFAFLFGMMALSLAAIGSVFVTHEGAKPSFVYAAVAAAILSIVFSFAPALYLRFLGRLAWIIEDDVRKREELKLEKENEGDEDTDEE